MTVNQLTKLDGTKNRYSVTFDDGTMLKLNDDMLARFGIHAGQEFSDEEFSQLCDVLQVNTAKERAIRILGSRNLSAGEMKRRLVSKGEAPEASAQAVQWLESIGAIDDPQYAKTIVRHYSGKGYGEKRIRHELFARGIERELWGEALAEMPENDDAAMRFLSKKLQGSDDEADARRAKDALVRRGYTYEQANSLVRNYLTTS
jgi:regulatory protein